MQLDESIVFFFKRVLSMVFLLILDIPFHTLNIRFAHTETSISFLPFKLRLVLLT